MGLELYKQIVQKIKNNKERRESGKDVCIRWKGFPRLSKLYPGVFKSCYYIISANQKVGKTQIADDLFVIQPIEFIMKANSGLKLNIKYFSLEMSKEAKTMQILSNKIYKDTGKIYDYKYLLSYYEDKIVDDDLITLLESPEYEAFFENFFKYVTIIDNIRNPYGIYKYMRDVAYEQGQFYYKGEKVDTKTNNWQWDNYVENDEDLVTECIVDSVNLFIPEKTNGNTLWDAIKIYSGEYSLMMRDKFKFTLCNIQQQSADSEKQQFNFKGTTIIDKIKPSADGLGDCKLTARDCNVLITLFNPYRYSIDVYEGYDITKLKDNFRELNINFDRNGGGNISTPLFFNGACNYFEELKLPNEIKQADYDMYKKMIN